MKYTTLREEIEGICKETHYPVNWPRHDCCPCCQNKKIFPFFKKFNIQHDKCASCQFVFVNPYPDLTTSYNIYNQSYYPAVRNHIEIPHALKNGGKISCFMDDEEYHLIVSKVHKKVSSGRWLDVGGGIGSFVNWIKNNYPSYEVFLNENNECSLKIAKEVFGINTLDHSPEALHDAGMRFDVISVVAVLEHISNPIDFVNKYCQLLNPGGCFVIFIPQFTRLNRWFSRADSSNVIPPYHLSLFNKKNIKEMLTNNTPLNDIEVTESGSASFSFQHLLNIPEVYDVKIPTAEEPRQDLLVVKKLTLAQRVFRKILFLLDLDTMLKNRIEKADGRLFLTVIGTSKSY